MAQRALAHAEAWLREVADQGGSGVYLAAEAGARRFALTLGRALALALLIQQAQWSIDNEQDGRARVAARRFARSVIDLIVDVDPAGSLALANDEPLLAS